jgi:hypothetical protein
LFSSFKKVILIVLNRGCMSMFMIWLALGNAYYICIVHIAIYELYKIVPISRYYK